MLPVLFLAFGLSFAQSDDNPQIPNVADLPVFPGSVGNTGNLDDRNGLPGGFGNLGLVPLTNFGTGPVGNIGQDNGQFGVGNFPIGPPSSQSNGQGGVGILPIVGSQNNGQRSIVNLPNNGLVDLGYLINVLQSNNGVIDLGNLTNLLQSNNGQGGIGNLQVVGTQSNGQGGIGNLPVTGSQNNGQGDIGNLPITGIQNPLSGIQGGFNQSNGGDDFNQNNGGGSVNQNNGGGGVNQNNGGDGFNQNNGQGSFNQTNGQGGFNQNGTQGPLSNLVPDLVADLAAVLNLANLNNLTGIERPCQVFDIYCIRRYFKKYGKCKEVRGPVPEPYYRAQSSFQIPTINATFSAFNVLYEGLNGRIVEFYINRRTDKLVISIEFRNVTIFSRDVYYRFYRRSREPITTYDYLYINYRSFITTTIIPKIRDLQLYKSETSTFTNDAIPSYSIGPNAFSDPDPTVQMTRIALLANLPTFVQEVQLTQGPFAAATFIQNSICDFKLKVL